MLKDPLVRLFEKVEGMIDGAQDFFSARDAVQEAERIYQDAQQGVVDYQGEKTKVFDPSSEDGQRRIDSAYERLAKAREAFGRFVPSRDEYLALGTGQKANLTRGADQDEPPPP